jgi:hypothetical protein
MKKPIPYMAALLSVGCGVDISVELIRQGDPTAFVATHAGTTTDYPMRLTRGKLLLSTRVGTSIDDLAALNGPQDFDFLSSEKLSFSGLANVPESHRSPLFTEFVLLNGDAQDEEMSGFALLVEGTVTLSDGSVRPLTARVPAPAEGNTRLLAVQKMLVGGSSAEAFFLPEVLFHQIDFDRLGAGSSEIIIEPGTGNNDIELSLAILQENLELAFQGTFEFWF